jgi:hypothetical protein
MPRKEIRFPERGYGVELEFASALNKGAVAQLLRSNGIDAYINGDADYQREGTWCVKNDGSIRGPESHRYTVEIASPVLHGLNGLGQIERILAALGDNVISNRSCGLHVHVDARDLQLKHFRNVGEVFLKFERVIERLVAPSRRGNDYCRRFSRYFNLQNVRSMSNYNIRSTERYCALNLYSYVAHGSIEFRLHQGTKNYRRIRNWVIFCVMMVHRASSRRVRSEVIGAAFSYKKAFVYLMRSIGMYATPTSVIVDGVIRDAALYLKHRLKFFLKQDGLSMDDEACPAFTRQPQQRVAGGTW